MTEKDIMKREILYTVRSIYEMATANHAQTLEVTLKAENGIATYEVYMDGVCVAPKNGDLSN